jgi:hypothetical protein
VDAIVEHILFYNFEGKILEVSENAYFMTKKYITKLFQCLNNGKKFTFTGSVCVGFNWQLYNAISLSFWHIAALN